MISTCSLPNEIIADIKSNFIIATRDIKQLFLVGLDHYVKSFFRKYFTIQWAIFDRAVAHNWYIFDIFINNSSIYHAYWTFYVTTTSVLKWSGGCSTGTVDWLSASERGQYLDGCPAMNTKCLVSLPFLPDLILWSTENRFHGSPVLVPPETQ